VGPGDRRRQGRKGLTPFLDMAYQGFGHGIAEDGAVVGKFVAAGLDFFVSTSFSKSFSLYGERVGALSVVCASKEEAARVLSQLKIVIRTNYSNPPTTAAPWWPRCWQPRTARPVGKGTGRDARAHQGHASEAGGRPEGRRRASRT
jgi:aspartate/methionine/tyrosine aminotransferase